jgi:hypothetical protein
MRGINALEVFLENWNSKIRDSGGFFELDAVVEYRFGSNTKLYSTNIVIEKFFDKKISINNTEEINEFLPEELEYDFLTGNLYIKRNLFKIKIAPKIY